MENKASLSQNAAFLHRVFDRQLIPSMLVSLGYTLNVLFDGIIVGQKLGVESFAAINICMPVYLFLCTVGSLIGVGCYLLSSRAIGAGDPARGNRIFNSAMLLMAAVSIAVTAAGTALAGPVSVLLCGGQTNPEVYDYALVTLIGAAPKLFLYIPMYYLMLDGKGKWASVCTVIMTAVNILLDLIMVCVLEMGTAGAAWASVIATAVCTVTGFIILLRGGSFRVDFRFEKKGLLRDMFRYGLPNAANNLMAALRVLCLNSILLGIGTDAVCLFSVLNNLNELSLVIVDGVPKTATPLLAIYSAEHSDRGIRILMKHQFRVGLILTAVFAAGVTLFSGGIALLYGMEPAETGSLTLPFACFGLATVIALILRTLTLYYNADGKNILSTALTAARILIFPVLLLLLMKAIGAYLWAFWPAAEAAGLALLLVGLLFRPKGLSYPLLLKDNIGEKALEFSVPATDTEICTASEKIGAYCEEFGMDTRQTMRICMALEEVLTLTRQKCSLKETDTFDLRVFAGEKRTGIRIRCTGKSYDPFSQPEDSEECMGVRMIRSITGDITYNYVYGMNNVLILL